MRWIGWALAWALYWLGDVVSRTLMRFGFAYPFYNWLMTKSAVVQDRFGLGPWSTIR